MAAANDSIACLPLRKAAELSGVGAQTIRNYAQRGLVVPRRVGNHTLYAPADIPRLALIGRLSSELNANTRGVKLFLHLIDRLKAQDEEIVALRTALQSKNDPSVNGAKECGRRPPDLIC